MEEAEKMVALKKAYADIILNTAKEAAGRIMVSERKALRLQQDLFLSKEEALNMLLRLKQMMDFKLAEVETTAFNRQKRIQELEVQLHDAESKVRDLREEVNRLQDESEKVKNNSAQSLAEQTVKEKAVSHEEISQENKRNISNSMSYPLSNSDPGHMSTCDIENAPLNQRNTDEKCCSLLETETVGTEPLSGSYEENYYAVNPDLASIIMRSKEPEPYKNGCTQRIRAFERNLCNGKLPLSEHTDDQYLHIKSESIIRQGEKDEENCTISSPEAENKITVEKNPIELEEITQHDSISDKDESIVHRSSSRRRTRYRKTKTASIISLPDQVMKFCEPSILPCSGKRNVESGDDSSRRISDDAEKDSDSSLIPKSLPITTELDPQLGCMDATGSDSKVNKTCDVQNATNEDTMLIESTWRKQEIKAAEVSGKANLETNDASLTNSDYKDKETCEATIGAPTRTVNNGLLKYTFQRKRKRGSLSCPDKSASFENTTLKRRIGDKQQGAQEPQKSSLIIESSRDSRRLAQVARQLISLSGKRWRS